MDWLDQFQKFYKEFYELDPEDIFNGPDTAEGIYKLADVYSLFTVEVARGLLREKLNRKMEIDRIINIDFVDHKDNYVHFLSKHSLGEHETYVLLLKEHFSYGKLAEDTMEFNNNTVGIISTLLRGYCHTEHYIKPKRDDKFVNLGRTLVPDPNLLDSYLKIEG